MGNFAVFVTVFCGLLASSQARAVISKEKCEKDFSVSEESWYSIKKMKEKQTNQLSTDNCAVDGDELLHTATARQLVDDVPQAGEKVGPQGQRKKRKAMAFEKFHPTAKWEVRLITFFIDPEFTDAEEDTILTALDYFSSITCFDFERGSVPDDDVLVTFNKARSCLTFMGKVPDEDLPHKVFLSAECTDMAGEVVHQLGHMIGLWHEHQRPDRDEYVKIQLENFKEGETGNHMVFKDHVDTYNLPYDYGSIMHLGPADSANVTNENEVLFTMVATGDPDVAVYHRRAMGQRAEASFWDKKLINMLYCTASCPPSPQSCQNNGYRDPRDCSTCVCPDGYGGNTCNRRGVYNSEAGCGGQLRAGSSVEHVTSPGYDSDTPYDVGTTCSWSITASRGERVKLKFVDDFGVYCRGKEETCYHWVEIRTGDDLTVPGIRFCCGETPELTLISTSNEALVIFKSLHPVADSERRGFKFAYTAVDACAAMPCENGGSCRPDDDEESGFRCICTDEYEGITCSDRVEVCPCENGGNCVFSDDGTFLECKCPENFEGEMCEYGCGTCKIMPKRTFWKQVAPPECVGYRVAQKKVCVTVTTRKRGWWWWWHTVTKKVCHYEDDSGVGPYCGCGWKLYENREGELLCAMVGYGEWSSPQCYGRHGCMRYRYRYHYDVVAWASLCYDRYRTTHWEQKWLPADQ